MKKLLIAICLIILLSFISGCQKTGDTPGPAPEETNVEETNVEETAVEETAVEETAVEETLPEVTGAEETTSEKIENINLETWYGNNSGKAKIETWYGAGRGEYEVVISDFPVKIKWKIEITDVILDVYEDQYLEGRGKILLSEDKLRDVLLFERFEVTDETLKNVEGKIQGSKKIKALESMKEQEFSRDDFKNVLSGSGLTAEEVETVIEAALYTEGDKMGVFWKETEYEFGFSGKKEDNKYIIDKFYNIYGKIKTDGPSIYSPEYDVPLIYTGIPLISEGSIQFNHEEEGPPPDGINEIKGNFSIDLNR